jgi:hypothetical protein
LFLILGLYAQHLDFQSEQLPYNGKTIYVLRYSNKNKKNNKKNNNKKIIIINNNNNNNNNNKQRFYRSSI